jgi:hypothetical protein
MHTRLYFGTLLLFLATGCSSGDDDAASNGGSGGQATGGSGGQTTGGSGGQTTGGTGGSAGQAAAGTSGSAGQSGTPDYPTDITADGIKAFIDAGSYRDSAWASSMTGATEPPMGTLSPHGLEYIWYNHTLRQAHADGQTSVMGSMAVKEIYTGSNVIGHAAMLRSNNAWVMFCTASESDRCYAGYAAGTVAYSTAIANCGCHGGGTIVTASEMPPP